MHQIELELKNEELRRMQEQRNQAENALHKSELKYRTLIENTSEVIFCVDKNGYYTFVNYALASKFGKTPEDFVDKSFWDIYSKEQADHRYEATSKVFQTGEKVHEEVTVPLSDRTLYYLASISPVKDSEGNVILALVHSVDITDRKKAEMMLHRNAEIQTVLKEIAEAAVLAPSMDELYRAVHRLVGRALPAKLFHINLLDEAINEIVVPFMADDMNFIPSHRPIGKGMTEYIMGLGRTTYITPAENDRLTKAGKYNLSEEQKEKVRHYLGAPLIDSKGKPFGVMVLIQMGENESFQSQDIEVLSIIAAQVSMAIERKQAETKLRESEDRFRRLSENARDMIYRMSLPDGKYEYVSPSSLQLTGFT